MHHWTRSLLGPAVLALGIGLLAAPAGAVQTTGTPGAPDATTTIAGDQLPAPQPTFGGVINNDALTVDAMVGAAHRAAEEGAERPPHHHRRRRFRRAEHFRRRHPDADHGPHRQERPALQQHPLDGAVLADAGGADHRPEPPLGRLRRHLRAVDRLPRLQQHHPRGQGDHRPDPPRQRLCHGLVRQGPQHPGLRRELGRPVRPVADRHGLRIFLRLRRRRRQPVAAEPLPQHHPDLPLRGQAGLEPDHRHGRRRHRLPQPPQPDDAGQAVLHQVRPRRHPCPAPPDGGMGEEDPRHAPVRRRLREARASRSSRTRRSSA